MQHHDWCGCSNIVNIYPRLHVLFTSTLLRIRGKLSQYRHSGRDCHFVQARRILNSNARHLFLIFCYYPASIGSSALLPSSSVVTSTYHGNRMYSINCRKLAWFWVVYAFCFFFIYVASCCANNGPRWRRPPCLLDNVHDNFLQIAYMIARRIWVGKGREYMARQGQAIYYSLPFPIHILLLATV